MPLSLYNQPNQINDLIRAAHPGGGTSVIDVPSPSGGEGHVEDSIEHQLQTLRMVYTEPTARVLANLATQLEKQGDMFLTIEVDNLAHDFIKSAAEPEEGMSMMPEAETGMSMEPEAPAEEPEPEPIANEDRTPIQRAIRIGNRMIWYSTRIKNMGIDKLNSKLVSDPKVREEGHRDDAKRAYAIWVKVYKALVSKAGWDKQAAIAKSLETFAEATAKYLDTVGDLERNTGWIFDDDVEDIEGYSGIIKTLRGVEDPEVGIPRLFQVASWLDPASPNFEQAEAFVDDLPMAGKAEEGRARKRITMPTMDFTKPDEGASKGVPSTTPPGEARAADPATKKEKGKATPPGKALKQVVQEVQKMIGAKVTGKYDEETHAALNTWLEQTKDKEGDPNQAKAQHIWKNVYDFTKGLDWGSTRLNRIYNVLKGKESLKEVEGVDVPQTTHITFVSPVTGRTIKDYFFTIAIDEARRNPYFLIRSLQRAGALSRKMSDKDILTKGTPIEDVGRALAEAIKAEGKESPEVAMAMAGWFKVLANEARRMIGQPTTKTVFEWLQGTASNVAQNLSRSTEAMESYINKMYAANMGDQKGYINEEAVKGKKRDAVNLAQLAVEENAATMQAQPQADPTKAGRPGQSVPEVPKGERITYNQLKPNEKSQVDIIINKGLEQAKQNPKYENQLAVDVEERVMMMNPRLTGIQSVFKLRLRKQKGELDPKAPEAAKAKPGKAPTVMDLPKEQQAQVVAITKRHAAEAKKNPKAQKQHEQGAVAEVQKLVPNIDANSIMNLVRVYVRQMGAAPAAQPAAVALPPHAQKLVNELANNVLTTGKPIDQGTMKTYFEQAQKSGYRDTFENFSKRVSGRASALKTLQVAKNLPKPTPVSQQPAVQQLGKQPAQPGQAVAPTGAAKPVAGPQQLAGPKEYEKALKPKMQGQ